MSSLSSNMIITILITVMPWAQVVGISENGFTIVEDSLLRIYLENYEGTLLDSGINLNIWSFLPAPKNGNLISLTLLFTNLILTLVTLRSNLPLSQRFLSSLYRTSTLCLLLLPNPNTPVFSAISLVSLSLMNFSNLTPRVTLAHLLMSLPS